MVVFDVVVDSGRSVTTTSRDVGCGFVYGSLTFAKRIVIEYGMLPRDVAARLGDRSYTGFCVTARLKQMNKMLDAVLGQRVAEKRGKNWALTSFMREAWDSTKDEFDGHVQRD